MIVMFSVLVCSMLRTAARVDELIDYINSRSDDLAPRVAGLLKNR